MKVSDLKPAEYNPRKITDDKLSMLDKAMRAFGDLSGVVFNRKTGNLIGGHQRCKNLDPDWKVERKPFEDDLGTVAQGYIETPFGRWVYREVEWDKNKEAAANVAANQHGGEWLYTELTNIMTELDNGEFDMDLLGFGQDELENLLGYVPGGEFPGLPDGDKEPFQQMTFTLHDTQAEQVTEALKFSKSMGEFMDSPNENSNGNALARICETFITGHGKS